MITIIGTLQTLFLELFIDKKKEIQTYNLDINILLGTSNENTNTMDQFFFCKDVETRRTPPHNSPQFELNRSIVYI